MANVKFSRKEFEKQIKLTEEIKEKIALFGTPLESVTDDEIELEIFPNRPDLLSLQGFLRGFLSFLGKKKTPTYKINKPEKDYEVKIDKSVKEVRPFTTCCIVKNLKFNDEKIKEIIDIQEKIHGTLGRNRKKIAIGIYPLEKITLPITYEARKPKDIKFIPLEMDQELSGLQILQRHPTGREYAFLLEGKEKFPVFIDAAGEILSMPPIINSHKTGKIEESTKDVFIECSGFDFEILKKTLNILTTLFSDLGGSVYQMKLTGINEITPDLTPEKMKIDIEECNKLLGLELKEKEFEKLAKKMGYDYKNKTVEIPAYRTDVLHPVDVYEDIAIAYGYDNFIPALPEISTIGKEEDVVIKKRKISEILSGLGFQEVLTYHLTTKEDLKRTTLKLETIELEDSKTDYKILKPNMAVSTLKVLSDNVDARYPQKIFELGVIFEKDESKETGIIEKEKLSIAVSGETDFTEIKQVLGYLMKMLGKEFVIEETENKLCIEGRCGKIIVGDKEIGFLGEIRPSILKNFHLKMPTIILEIDFERLFN